MTTTTMKPRVTSFAPQFLVDDLERFTSWDAVFHQLRAVFPDECYHHGHHCLGLSTAGEQPVAEFATGERVEADLVIGADGVVIMGEEVVTPKDTAPNAGKLFGGASRMYGVRSRTPSGCSPSGRPP